MFEKPITRYNITTPTHVARKRLMIGSPACSPMTRVLSNKKALFQTTFRNRAHGMPSVEKE